MGRGQRSRRGGGARTAGSGRLIYAPALTRRCPLSRRVRWEILPLLGALACHRDKADTAEACPDATLTVTTDAISLEAGACASLDLEPEIVGEGALSVSLREVDGGVLPVIEAGPGGGVFRALALHGPLSLAGDADAVLWKQGYQSWWWSGVTTLSAMTLNEDGLPQAGGDGDGASAVAETPFSSWWVGLLGRPEGYSLLLGALSATETKFYVAFSADEAWAVWGGRGEAVSLAEGEQLVLDPLHVATGPSSWSLYSAYAEAVAGWQGVAAPTEAPPVGWSSWTVSYADLDEETVLGNLEAATALADAGGLASLDLLQIDDGWEKAWGDWTANERFPSGMASVASAISDAGLRPGLWMAPLYVEASLDVAEAHPDWFVHDEDGAQLSFSNFSDQRYLTLDVTQPEAAAWLHDQIAAQVAAGFTYLKLDFLYAGAQEGVRAEDVTGAVAFQRGMAILRDAAGPDTWILACGAPMLPSVGHVQSYRTGADIAFGFDPDPRDAYLRWQGRASAARAWQNGVWWWVDPDAILVREPFDDTQATGSVAANAASGGVWVLGDDLRTLDPDRLALALNPDVVALRGQRVEAEDPLSYPSGPDIGPLGELASPDDQVPVRWTLADGTEILLNLSEDAVTVDGSGGVELQSGETAAAGSRTLAPGAGEVWGR